MIADAAAFVPEGQPAPENVYEFEIPSPSPSPLETIIVQNNDTQEQGYTQYPAETGTVWSDHGTKWAPSGLTLEDGVTTTKYTSNANAWAQFKPN